MALPNSSATVSAGDVIATNTIGDKEYQVVQFADPQGHIVGSRDDYLAYYTPQTNASGREVAELFNAEAGKLIRVRGIWIIPTVTAITGVQVGFDTNRISAVGTGGTLVTPRPTDTTMAAIPAGVTARFGATGGAPLVYLYFQTYTFNDETNAAAQLVAYSNQLPQLGDRVSEIVLRTGEGLQIKQSVAATAGLTGALIQFAVE